MITDANKVRPILKWAGGKFNLLDPIRERLPPGKVLIEPFVGSGTVFLNTEYSRYILSDTNQDLINLYQCVQQEGSRFIESLRKLFTPANNTEEQYYALRAQFNECKDARKRAILFFYLNRHGYNGLCRYNQSGHFNVPFGRYRNPYFPEVELAFFYQKSQQATFICQDFREVMNNAKKGQVIYCDPPYVPLSDSANFTTYYRQAFSLESQSELAELARGLCHRGVSVLLSNHDTPFTREIYQEADIFPLSVRRSISCKADDRKYAREVLALFLAEG